MALGNSAELLGFGLVHDYQLLGRLGFGVLEDIIIYYTMLYILLNNMTYFKILYYIRIPQLGVLDVSRVSRFLYLPHELDPAGAI